jgi:hypothetical protein
MENVGEAVALANAFDELDVASAPGLTDLEFRTTVVASSRRRVVASSRRRVGLAAPREEWGSEGAREGGRGKERR